MTFGVFLIGALLMQQGVHNDFSGGATGLVIAQGEEKPISLSSIMIVILVISNLLTFYLWLIQKGRNLHA